MLRLRPFLRTDIKTMSEWMGNNEKIEDFGLSLETLLEQEDCCPMVSLDDKGAVGLVVLGFEEEWNRQAKLVYFIVSPKKRGRGNAQKMLRLSLRYAFEFMQIECVNACIDKKYDKAYHSVNSLGFRELCCEDETNANEGKEYDLVLRSLEDMENQETSDDYEEDVVKKILDENLFSYAFQPIVEAATGDIYGYEALMRGECGGIVLPNIILEYATKHNRLYDVERATYFNVMSSVLENIALFGERKIFINSIPGYFLKDDDFRELRRQYGALLDRFVVEITEATELKDDELEILIKRSRKDAFGVAIDDYGTGYSNTSSLLRCLPNCIKIDRLLIANIHEDAKKQHFVNSIIEFAHDNGIKTLAEGVETGAELRCVIAMGIDLIQGYYTARPSFEVIREIAPDIRNEMISVNVREQNQNDRRVYTVKEEKELPLMRLALEQYTAILLTGGEFRLVGNADYVAGMTIRTKDGSDSRLVLRNVYLESFQHLPCVELGKDSKLTIVLEDGNVFNKAGILVPDSASLTIEGTGDLKIKSQGIQSYGIGNNWDSGVGDITWASTGTLEILVEADEAIAMGGGIYRKGKGIQIHSGTVKLTVASMRSVALGSVQGDIPIVVENCNMSINLNSDHSVGIGAIGGVQNTHIYRSNIYIDGAGSFVTGIGGRNYSAGRIRILHSEIDVKANGQVVELFGTPGGELEAELEKVTMSLRGEGSDVLGFGTRDKKMKASIRDSEVDINIHAAKFLLLAAETENVVQENTSIILRANED